MVADSPEADEYNYYDEYWRCGRADKCGQAAGMGTDHNGVGACKFHGGNAGRPIEHGIYSDAVREEDQAVLEALEEIQTAQKLEETLNLQIMKLRRAVELTENPDAETDFWGMFENLVASAGEGELDASLVRELSKLLQAPSRSQRELMDLIRKTAKDLHKITDGEDINVSQELSVDDDSVDEIRDLMESAYE